MVTTEAGNHSKFYLEKILKYAVVENYIAEPIKYEYI